MATDGSRGSTVGADDPFQHIPVGLELFGDLGRLVDDRLHELFRHIGLEAEQFRRCHDQGQVVVDLVPHVGKSLGKFLHLFRRQRHGAFR